MKIALVGSAPSSVHLAPYDDPSWIIWGCSPGALPHLRRCDAFFEIHHWLPGENGFSPSFIEGMSRLSCPVYTLREQPEIPTSTIFPAEALLAKYPGLARSFFTSSLSWMLAFAIEQEPEEIGLWGVDMAASDEYGHQKPGCHFFIMEAERRGIKVAVPPQSDLLRPIPLYGVGEISPMRIKLEARRREISGRINAVRQEKEQADLLYRQKLNEEHFLTGALDDLQYVLNTWVD